jgi:hypothetical protein
MGKRQKGTDKKGQSFEVLKFTYRFFKITFSIIAIIFFICYKECGDRRKDDLFT